MPSNVSDKRCDRRFVVIDHCCEAGQSSLIYELFGNIIAF